MITIGEYVINKTVLEILYDVKRRITNGKLTQIIETNDEIKVTCPFHAGGHEHTPSCFIRKDDGVFHCFSCGEAGGLAKFVAACFDSSISFAEKWILESCGYTYLNSSLNLQEIRLEKDIKNVTTLVDESILDTFESYHPYMTKRHLTDDVIKKFQIKYDPKTKCIVFPMRNKKGQLVGFTRRAVEGKAFIIDRNFDKSNIYLLDNVIKNDLKEVYVCESQLNCLTLEGWGFNAIALIGAGTTNEQMTELNKTNVKHWILVYDNDDAGHKGEQRFRKLVRKDVFVDTIWCPKGRDVNDLTKDEFISLQLSKDSV